jgi:hypothetical protein
MASQSSPSFRFRIRKLKAALLAAGLTLAGIILIWLGSWIVGLSLGSWSWLHAVPLGELGGVLVGAGLLSTLFEYSFRKDQEEATVEQFRNIIREQAPAMRDAVVEGFAIHPDDLKRVATPELLDDLATNSLALSFGDPAFATEVYGDIKRQAIRAAERWYDARVSIDLGIPRSSTIGATRASLFDVVVRWEYTVVPKYRYRKFVVVSDRRRYEELAAEGGETSVWFKPATTGLDVTDSDNFELVQFTLGGQELKIRRSTDAVSQTYRVDLGETGIGDDKDVVLSFTYRSRLPQSGHLLHIDIDRPTRGLSVEFDYTKAGITRLKTIDYLSSGRQARVSDYPAATGTQVVTVGYDGWIMPKAGLAFVWTLEHEVMNGVADEHARHAETT